LQKRDKQGKVLPNRYTSFCTRHSYIFVLK